MSTTAIQLYTLREIDEPLPSLLDRVGQTSFDGVEFAHRFADAETAQVADALERNGLDAVSAHVDIDRLETDPAGTVATYAEIGCDTLVVPWLDPDQFADADSVATTAERLTRLAELVADAGGTLQYHNHDHELVSLGEQTALEALIRQSGDALGFEFDIGWIEAGGAAPEAFIETHADRIELLHLTDCSEDGTPTEVGTGAVDVTSCLEAALGNVATIVYEHDEPNDPQSSLEHGSALLAD
ncbi:sugar phosphate isomerase/epimerase family protein [Halocatena pleomorpha]|uniref:Sugar phosphate isomerase/epimerase n=1 Tax=Halocatena pleomorpha TaxID=1785090 RepID=A0A3P3RB43_9EURY|nr:sugar phosphate isomerase/epimerase [Halocatena pleomorpha]RRJ29663.1 sugar phosphate isomerase/epimerase [Halocatena pleomorpha]